MTSSVKLAGWCLALLALATSAPDAMRGIGAAAECITAPPHGSQALRTMLERHAPQGEEVSFVSSGDIREKSAERDAVQSIVWRSMPSAVKCHSTSETVDSGFAVVSRFNDKANSAFSLGGLFRLVNSTESWNLWERTDIRKTEARNSAHLGNPPQSAAVEALSMLPLAIPCLLGLWAGGISGMLLSLFAFTVTLFAGGISGLA